jgi:protocatechuate 3,4-dioxygenase beta subunit
MNLPSPKWHRRAFLQQATLGSAALFTVPGAFAEALVQTPPLAEGPFYPDRLPLDTDNDLILLNDAITPAVGEVTHLTGRVRILGGKAVSNALVEIWQVDNNAVYIHSGSDNKENQDKNFQGYGRFSTDRKGRYYFRTIKPVAYPGRTPHIHVAVSKGGKRLLTTQLLIQGEAANTRDGLFKRIKDPKLQDALQVKFTPLKKSKTGELKAHFEIVLGLTPMD